MHAMGPGDVHETHAILEGALPADALDSMASAILAGDPALAERIIAASVTGGRFGDGEVLAYARALCGKASAGRAMSADEVVEDLRMQHVQGDVVRCIVAGRRSTAALLMVLHEGYGGATSLDAVDIMSPGALGSDVHLVPVGPGDVVPWAEGGGHPTYVVRHGAALAAGAFLDRGGPEGPRASFDVGGDRVDAGDLAQIWVAVPATGPHLRTRVAEAVRSGRTGDALVEEILARLGHGGGHDR